MIVRHILRKDWRLLWPFVVALAVLQVLLGAAGYALGGQIVPVALLALLVSGTVITLAVLQDPVPGMHQDWLVRPIPRQDLVVAKLLFVVLCVQGPWLITDVAQGLINGFPLSQSAAAATACAAWVLLTMTVPVLAFAALTSTLTETLVGTLVAVAVMLTFLIVPPVVGASRPALQTGYAWVPALVREALLLAAAIAVLTLQYRGRRTTMARVVFAIAFVAGQATPLLPWRAALHVDQLLSSEARHDDHAVAIAFAPSAGRFRAILGQSLDDVAEKPGLGPVDAGEESQRRRAEGAQTILFPIRVSGLVPGSRLLADRSEFRLVARDGRTVYRGQGNDLELRATGTSADVHHGIRIPRAVYSRIKDEALDVQLDYWFTSLVADPTYALAASGGDERMPGIGRCRTKVDDSGTRVLLRCMQPGERPSCLAVVLEHTPTHQRNPEVSLCAPDYSPYPGHVLPDALSRFGGRLPFYDPSGIVRYTVSGQQLSESRVLVTNFRPTAHLIRQIIVPSIRLQDWEPQGP